MYLDLCGRRVPFQALESSSFAGFLSSYAPQLLPGMSWQDLPAANGTAAALPHATTIVAVACDEGVVLASDRRATAGSMISKRDVDKVFRCDESRAHRSLSPSGSSVPPFNQGPDDSIPQ
ncbi:MAG TPA: hypothetical protein VFW50_45890 [Streptosporangiaceae bacterium]|nr:hypothetical protein [Streptosporangiaceae bacterium]